MVARLEIGPNVSNIHDRRTQGTAARAAHMEAFSQTHPSNIPPEIAMAELGIKPFEAEQAELFKDGYYNTALGDQMITTFAPIVIGALERIDPLWQRAKQGANVAAEKTLDILDAVALKAVNISNKYIARPIERHPRITGGITTGVLAFAEACGVATPIAPPNEGNRQAEVQPANSNQSGPAAFQTAIAQGTPPASEVYIPITTKDGPIGNPSNTQSPEANQKPGTEVRETKPWEKHFTLVSPGEAREMLAQAKERGQFRFLAPQFDLDKVTKDFAIENRTLSNQTTTVVYLALRGIGQGATFYANHDGQGSSNAPSSGLTRFISIGIDNGNIRQNISTTAAPDYKTLPVGRPDWPLASVHGVKGATVSLKVGDPLFTLPTEEIIDEGISSSAGGGTWRERLGDWQVHYFIKRGDDFSLAKLEDVLRHPQTGKMVTLDTTMLTQAK